MIFLLALGLLPVTGAIQVTPEPVAFHKPLLTGSYMKYPQMTQFLKEIARNYSDFATLYTIGQSANQKELWVLKIKSPNSQILGTPHIKFVGNIHGNEPVGKQLILYLAEYLIKNYEINDEVKWLLDSTVIHLLPSMNPDGFEMSVEGECYSGPGRENKNFVDLNRNFPDPSIESLVPIQPETAAVIRWMSEIPFVLSASFHGGALVANYPFDKSSGNEKDLLAPPSSLTPDDDVFKHLAQTYSSNHFVMHKGRRCSDNQPSFPGGITNGAAWYSFSGGMQDYNYISQGCMELTLEISCCKYPQASNLYRLWAENKQAMLELAKQAHTGVKGLILNKLTSAPVSGANLYIVDRQMNFTSSKNGEFWRILLPGQYILAVEAKEYESQMFPFTVVQANASRPTATWLNIYLQPSENSVLSSSSPDLRAATLPFWFFIILVVWCLTSRF